MPVTEKKYPQPVDTYIGVVTPEGVIQSNKRKVSLTDAEVWEYGFSKAVWELCPDDWKKNRISTISLQHRYRPCPAGFIKSAGSDWKNYISWTQSIWYVWIKQKSFQKSVRNSGNFWRRYRWFWKCVERTFLTESLIHYFRQIPDYRCGRETRHDLAEMLVCVTLGFLCGRTTIRRSLKWCKAHLEELRKHMELKYGIASPSTITRMPGGIDEELALYAFMEWIFPFVMPEFREYPKSIRRSFAGIKITRVLFLQWTAFSLFFPSFFAVSNRRKYPARDSSFSS